MFHKHKQEQSQISGHSHHNHKLALKPFLAVQQGMDSGATHSLKSHRCCHCGLSTMKQLQDNI